MSLNPDGRPTVDEGSAAQAALRTASGPPQVKPVEDCAQQLLGTWAVIHAELGGAPMPPEAAARVEIEFDSASTYRVRFAGEISDSGHFQLFAQTETTLHHRITLHGTVGTNAGRTLPGIFQLRGDRLKLCLALESAAPPTAFVSNAAASGKPCYLVTYRRTA